MRNQGRTMDNQVRHMAGRIALLAGCAAMLGWIGDTAPGGVFYYRIHSPVILIEFDHQRPVALGRS